MEAPIPSLKQGPGGSGFIQELQTSASSSPLGHTTLFSSLPVFGIILSRKDVFVYLRCCLSKRPPVDAGTAGS